jgi:flagellar biosynthetic protein FliR
MQGDLLISIPQLCAFLLVLVRISGVFVFVPIPGSTVGTPVPRIVLSLICTIALFPRWPEIQVVPGIALLVAWVLAEAALGLLAGVVFQFIAEAFSIGAQVLSLQAGYAYASTIDPNTQADSGILIILAQLTAGLLFFTAGLDRLLIAAFAASLETCPPGSFVPSAPVAHQVIALGTAMFMLGLRLALPVVALLLMVDIALGVLGRVSAQLQLISLTFPLKMVLSLAMLAMMLPLFPPLYEAHASKLLTALRGFLAAR